jgi:hypothetical protein
MKVPAHVKRLTEALENGLGEAGIPSEIESEPISGTRLSRVYVVAPRFRALRPSERQDLVWRIAQGVLTPEEQLLISMILTVTPAELAGSKP